MGIIAMLCVAFVAIATKVFSGKFYIITIDKQNVNVEWITQRVLSPQGQALVEKTGYVSIK